MTLRPLSEKELAELMEVLSDALDKPPAVGKVRPAWAFDDEVQGRLVLLHPETLARLLSMVATPSERVHLFNRARSDLI